MNPFQEQIKTLFENQEKLISKVNMPIKENNGWLQRYQNPILTAAHIPIVWRYDLNEKTNSFLMERIDDNWVITVGHESTPEDLSNL